jgi:predicted phosphohydrolase
MIEKKEYLWYTDLHLYSVLPWTLLFFITHIRKVNPKGIFLTGDIANGLVTAFFLRIMATLIKCPIYFVLGNHDYHFTSHEKMHAKLRKLCEKYPNLVWMTDSDAISLSEEVALIGDEGWYDLENGKKKYITFTLDWWLVKNFRVLPSMDVRMDFWRELAGKTAGNVELKLRKAIAQGHKTVYVLTHFPPWKEATNCVGKFLEGYWVPYNANLAMGRMLERVMKEHEDVRVIVLAGHTHHDCWIQVAHNLECKVNKAKHFGMIRDEEHIFI